MEKSISHQLKRGKFFFFFHGGTFPGMREIVRQRGRDTRLKEVSRGRNYSKEIFSPE